MATPVKISALPLLSSTPSDSVEIPVNDAGVTKKLTLSNLFTRVGVLSTLTAGITNTSIVSAINSVYATTASASSKGFVTTTSQTFAGDKTFNGSVILDGNQLSLKSNGSNYAVLKARTTMASSYILNLPVGLPVSTSFLTVDDSGNMAYTTSVVSSISTGAGLTGGPITSVGTISLAASGVTSGTYGSTTTVPIITIDTYGRITNASSGTIAIASASTTGFLTNADWASFDSKLDTPAITTGRVTLFNGSGLTEVNNFEQYDIISTAERTIKFPGTYNTGTEFKANIQTETTNFVMTGVENVIFLEPGSGSPITATLPDSSVLNEIELCYYFKVTNTGGSLVKILTQGADLIDGGTEISLNTTRGYAMVILKTSGRWEILYSK